VNLEGAVAAARERARALRVDPQLTISEVYLAELLGRLRRRLRGTVVWKGGAVLRLEGSERFSRDLDGTRRSASATGEALGAALDEAAENLPYLVGMTKAIKPQSVTAAYGMEAPGLRQTLRIEVDISLRERVLLPPAAISTARIAHPYGLLPVVVARLSPAELLAEKVRALVMRGAGRDLYDVYWLLQRGVELDAGLFREKMEYYPRAGATIDPAGAVERAIRRLESFSPSRAKAELIHLLPAAGRHLDLGIIAEDVSRALRSRLAGSR